VYQDPGKLDFYDKILQPFREKQAKESGLPISAELGDFEREWTFG
jgi:hypothetical protein